MHTIRRLNPNSLPLRNTRRVAELSVGKMAAMLLLLVDAGGSPGFGSDYLLPQKLYMGYGVFRSEYC